MSADPTRANTKYNMLRYPYFLKPSETSARPKKKVDTEVRRKNSPEAKPCGSEDAKMATSIK